MARTTRRKTADTSSSTTSNAAAGAAKGGGRKGPAKGKRKRETTEDDDGTKVKKKFDGKRYQYRKICSFDGCTTFARPGFEVCMKHGANVSKKLCSKEGCTNKAVKGGVCVKHGAKVKPTMCNYEGGCTNQAVKGGVCVKHGATYTKKLCSKEGCTNKAKNGGVCIKHGAKVKRCSNEGCTKHAQKGGVCIEHGAKVKLCSEEGCPNQAQNGGVCIRHGAKHKRCSIEECTNKAVNGGVCVKHGAKVKRCSNEGCTKHAQIGGVCIKHGAKVKRCSNEGCTKHAQKGGVCIKHGAMVKRCSIEECTNIAVKGGVCVKHGAMVKRCSIEECTNIAVKGGVCKRHGATVKRCSIEECTNIAVNGGVCRRHGAKLKVKRCSIEECTNIAVNGGVCKRHGAKVERKLCSNEECNNIAVKEGVCIRHGAKVKRCRTDLSIKSLRNRTSSAQNKPDSASALQSQSTRPAFKRKRLTGNDASKSKVPENELSSKDRGTIAKRRKANDVQAAAETLLSFATGTSNTQVDDSTDHGYDNDTFDPQKSEDLTAENDSPQGPCEAIPADVWDCRSFATSITAFLTIEEVKNLRLVSKTLHRHNPAKRARFKFSALSSMKTFLKRARSFPGPTQELFNRQQVEFVGSKFVNCLRNIFCSKASEEKSFFQQTNCLSGVRALTLSQQHDYRVLHTLGSMPSLEFLCFRQCTSSCMCRPLVMDLRSCYKSEDYRDINNVKHLKVVRCSLPHQLLRDVARGTRDLTSLTVRRCAPENVEDDDSDFFDVLSSLNLEVFKFVPDDLLAPSGTVAPTEEDAAREGLQFVHRNEEMDEFVHRNEEMDEYSRLRNRILQSVCKNEGLKSLSMRNVELFDGEGLKPLRNLHHIEKICLCALSSFQEYHLRLLSGVGERTLRVLSLAHCRLIEGHLDNLVGLTNLEELSLIATRLNGDDIRSLSNMRELKTLNISGTIKSDCNQSDLQLQSQTNLRQLSLQIFNNVSRDVALKLNNFQSLETLCLRMRFVDEDEIGDDEDEGPVIFHVDEESTLNITAAGSRMDESVMDVTTVNTHEDMGPFNFSSWLHSPLDFSSGLTSLRSLLIYDSVHTDNLVKSIADNLDQLQELSLWDCDTLTEESIDHLSRIQSLNKLVLHRFDAMTEEGLKRLSSLSSINELELYLCGNTCNFKIDNNLGSMKNLRRLTISPYYLKKPAHLTHITFVKDAKEKNTEKRVKHLLRKIQSRGLF